jgi:17beta-estradiol 17-dehydrogenase / very-long-chain 3-oxoacyl-CoA reductase
MVSINCFALSAICHKFIPIFSERLLKEGKRSAIINVGSVAG